MLRSITRHFWWKLFSVGLAFALWLLYSGTRELTTSISAPIQYRNIPKDLEISSEIAEQVHLVLRGPSPLLSRLNSSQMPVVLDLTNVHSAGQTTFTIDRRNVSLPAGISLERAIPSQVRLRLEDRLTREVPVHVLFENVPPGMEIAKVQLSPDRLTIAGPRSHVAEISRLETDPLDLSAVTGTVDLKTAASSGHAQVVFKSSPTVAVRVTLQSLQLGR